MCVCVWNKGAGSFRVGLSPWGKYRSRDRLTHWQFYILRSSIWYTRRILKGKRTANTHIVIEWKEPWVPLIRVWPQAPEVWIACVDLTFHTPSPYPRKNRYTPIISQSMGFPRWSPSRVVLKNQALLSVSSWDSHCWNANIHYFGENNSSIFSHWVGGGAKV